MNESAWQSDPQSESSCILKYLSQQSDKCRLTMEARQKEVNLFKNKKISVKFKRCSISIDPIIFTSESVKSPLKIAMAKVLHSQLFRYVDVVFIDSDQTYGESLNLLDTKFVFSAPVIKKSRGLIRSKEKLIGSINVFQLINSLISNITLGNSSDIEKLTITKLMQEQAKIFDSKVDWIPLTYNDPLHKFVYLISKGIIHIPVVSSLGSITALIDQWIIAEYINKKQIIGPYGQSSINEISLFNATPMLITAKSNIPTYDAIKILSTYEIPCLPIVDESSKLVGVLEPRDLQGLHMQNLFLISLPIIDYLKLSSGTYGDGIHDITLHPHDTFSAALSKFSKSKKDCLWVVGESCKLIGMIALRDCMKAIFSLFPEYQNSVVPLSWDLIKF